MKTLLFILLTLALLSVKLNATVAFGKYIGKERSEHLALKKLAYDVGRNTFFFIITKFLSLSLRVL